MKACLDPRRYRRERPPAVLLGGLNVARALGLAGVPLIVASASAHEPAFASRYCTGRLLLPRSGDAGAALEVLLRAGERLSGELGCKLPLFYGNDDAQRLVQQQRAALGQHYALLLNDPEVADALIEKDRFQPFALRRGLPVPRELAWDELAGFDAPVLIKPRTKFGWDNSPVYLQLFGRRGKACVFRDGRALLAHGRAREYAHALVIQEYVSGDDRHIWSFHGFADDAGRLIDGFIGRKIRTYPALTGLSTFLEMAHDEELAVLGPRLAAALPLKGVFKMDLKRDARSRRLYVLEVNARYNLWHYLGAANGVNLAGTAYEYLVHGRRVAAPRPLRSDHRWVYLRFDWHAYRELSRRGELGFLAWIASLARGPKVWQLFSWRDPLPFFSACYHWASERLPRVPAKLRRWLYTAS